jgi:hypothetical protein
MTAMRALGPPARRGMLGMTDTLAREKEQWRVASEE